MSDLSRVCPRLVACAIVCAAASLLGIGPQQALAHEMRPAYLELKQTGLETYDIFFKVPGQGEDLRLGLHVELPAGCTNISEPRAKMVNRAYVERWTVRCGSGLNGGTINITGLSATMTDTLVRVEHTDGTTQIIRLTAASPSFVVRASPDRWQVIRTYSALGVEHILTGLDHLLFILALIIITRGGWNLVKTVTAFTISHSITLTAATLGLVHVPAKPVEAVIALSILLVAAEIVQGYRGRMGITARAPWIVALTFGLLHGLGFAGGLSDAGIPPTHIPLALLFFSLGVEVGHFLFVGTVVAVVTTVRRVRLTPPRWARLVPPYAIGSLAAFWLIQRMAAF